MQRCEANQPYIRLLRCHADAEKHPSVSVTKRLAWYTPSYWQRACLLTSDRPHSDLNDHFAGVLAGE